MPGKRQRMVLQWKMTQERTRALFHPENDCGLPHYCCGGWCPVWWACTGGGGLAPQCRTDRLNLEVCPCLDLDPKSPTG